MFEISTQSSRDTHHHSTSHILYDHKKASRDSLIKSSRDLSAYAHTYRHLVENVLSYVHTHRDYCNTHNHTYVPISLARY